MDEANPLPPPQPGPAPEGTSRRWFLAGGTAALLAAGAGAVVELLRPEAISTPPLPPAGLVAAAHAEQALIADLDATTGGPPAVRRAIVQARADHAAHLRAITALLARFRAPSATQAPRPRGTPRTLAQLRTAEQQASTAAARRAAALTGGYAALLASIAACEATHGELLR